MSLLRSFTLLCAALACCVHVGNAVTVPPLGHPDTAAFHAHEPHQPNPETEPHRYAHRSEVHDSASAGHSLWDYDVIFHPQTLHLDAVQHWSGITYMQCLESATKIVLHLDLAAMDSEQRNSSAPASVKYEALKTPTYATMSSKFAACAESLGNSSSQSNNDLPPLYAAVTSAKNYTNDTHRVYIYRLRPVSLLEIMQPGSRLTLKHRASKPLTIKTLNNK